MQPDILRMIVSPWVFFPADLPREVRWLSLIVTPAGAFLPIFVVLGIIAAVEWLYMPLPEGAVTWILGAVIAAQLIRVGASMRRLPRESNAGSGTGDSEAAGSRNAGRDCT